MRTRHGGRTVALLALLSVPWPAGAELRVTAPISDGMVLQRHVPVPIRGSAEAGDEVAVTLDGQTYETRANAAGSWRIDLPPRAAGGPAR